MEKVFEFLKVSVILVFIYFVVRFVYKMISATLDKVVSFGKSMPFIPDYTEKEVNDELTKAISQLQSKYQYFRVHVTNGYKFATPLSVDALRSDALAIYEAFNLHRYSFNPMSFFEDEQLVMDILTGANNRRGYAYFSFQLLIVAYNRKYERDLMADFRRYLSSKQFEYVTKNLINPNFVLAYP